MKPIDHAYGSLVGLWVGDCFGSHYEFEAVDWNRPKIAANKRFLPPPLWYYTDDTEMGFSIYRTLNQFGLIDADALALSFVQHFNINRGYGLGAETLLMDPQYSADWATLASSMFDGQGSFGNGSAMRVAPIGAYFYDNMKLVVENAQHSSITTHTHIEGIAGAIAVAVGAAQATRFKEQGIKPDSKSFWEVILAHTPDSKVKNTLNKAINLSDASSEQAAKILGNGWDISAPDTVPFALWIAINYMTNYEEALWQTIRVGGDTDTTCAIVGGIVASYGNIDCIPDNWRNRCEALPDS